MQKTEQRAHGGPRISVVMANFQAGDKIVPALRSVLSQTMADLEVIVSDDASRDDSLVLVRTMMADDARIRVIAASMPIVCARAAMVSARACTAISEASRSAASSPSAKTRARVPNASPSPQGKPWISETESADPTASSDCIASIRPRTPASLLWKMPIAPLSHKAAAGW